MHIVLQKICLYPTEGKHLSHNEVGVSLFGVKVSLLTSVCYEVIAGGSTSQTVFYNAHTDGIVLHSNDSFSFQVH